MNRVVFEVNRKGMVNKIKQGSFIQLIDSKKKNQALHEYTLEAVKLIIFYINEVQLRFGSCLKQASGNIYGLNLRHLMLTISNG